MTSSLVARRVARRTASTVPTTVRGMPRASQTRGSTSAMPGLLSRRVARTGAVLTLGAYDRRATAAGPYVYDSAFIDTGLSHQCDDAIGQRCDLMPRRVGDGRRHRAVCY